MNEMMTWLEQQTNSEHLHLLHMANIKQYVCKSEMYLNFICIL
jgi:hypothetical protein